MAKVIPISLRNLPDPILMVHSSLGMSWQSGNATRMTSRQIRMTSQQFGNELFAATSILAPHKQPTCPTIAVARSSARYLVLARSAIFKMMAALEKWGREGGGGKEGGGGRREL